MKIFKLTQHIIGSISRTLLAITFLFSGFVKCVDPLGTVYKVEDYLTAMNEHFGSFFGQLLPAAGIIAVILILTEWLLGWLMFFNVRTNWTRWIALAFMLIMTPLTLWIALTGAVHDCGCFGDALVLTNWQTFYKNLVLLVLVLILIICNKAIPTLWSWLGDTILLILGLLIGIGIMGYSYRHLPIIDFRPYKVGNNLIELTTPPSPDTTLVSLIYEKEGMQQEFTIFNYPKGDSTWTFVDQVSTPCMFDEHHQPVPMSLEPVIGDLKLEMMGEDYTESILYSEEPVTLIVMYDLNKRNRKQAHRAAELYKEIRFHGGECYFLTGSTEEDIIAFAQEVGIDPYDDAFFFMDATPIKTIVRANPGIVILQNGIVREKHNMRDYMLDDWRLDVDD